MLLFCSSLLYSQEVFRLTKLDEALSVMMPEGNIVRDSVWNKVEIRENVWYNVSVLQNYSEEGNAGYLVTRVKMEADLEPLPEANKDLEKFYDAIGRGHRKSIEDKGYTFLSSSKVYVNNRLACRQIYTIGEKPAMEVQLHLFDGYMYAIYYINPIDFDEKTKESVLSSITIDSSKIPPK